MMELNGCRPKNRNSWFSFRQLTSVVGLIWRIAANFAKLPELMTEAPADLWTI
jgi:hypothetical protein